MARKRTLEAPSAEELRKIEEGFARETSTDFLGMRAPIAKVAADAAASMRLETADARVEREKDHRDAERLRDAEARGLLVQEIATASIEITELSRDRMELDGGEMAELVQSIRDHGLRLPIEVFPVKANETRYGLVAGYRRLAAVQRLYAETGDSKYSQIRALVVRPDTTADAYIAMVEENEIRSDLSQYERGRIVVVSAGQGVFSSFEEATQKLFPTASKAKRSKIRSFALIHQELGDLLQFPTQLPERAGLRIANALKAGFASELRRALADASATTLEAEQKKIEPLLKHAEELERDSSVGGRPSQVEVTKPVAGVVEKISENVEASIEINKQGYLIRLKGPGADAANLEDILESLRKLYR